MWQEAKKIIQKYQRFLLTTHVNPDGDGIGAACALAEFLLSLGKEVQFVCEGAVPPRFSFLNYRQIFQEYDPQKSYDQTEVLIILDAHTKQRIGELGILFQKPGIITLTIDHHQQCYPSCSSYSVSDVEACSVGAMIYSLLQECDFELTREAAAGIYTSIVCDTGRFSYSSVNQNAHLIAHACIKKGVDPEEMHERLFQHVPLEQIKLFASAIQNMEMYIDNRVIVQQLRCNECDLEYIDLEYMHEFNKLIDEVECVVLLHELAGDRVRVSLRSKSILDVAQLLKGIGGGGHVKAAGATINGSLNEVKNQILSLLEEALKSSII